MRNIVTVTCERDYKFLILQAKSIQKYVKECVHWIIINDIDTHRVDWESVLSPYYDNKNHILKIVYHDPKYWSLIHNGWVIQQILKLEAVNYVQDDYLLLDTKNFFTVPTDLSTWNKHGCGVLISNVINKSVYNLWLDVNQLYANHLQMPVLEIYYAPETPYFIKQEIVKDAISQPNFAEWFVENSYTLPGASEFIYYSYFLKKHGHLFKWGRRHHCLWPEHTEDKIDSWFEETNFRIMEITGIHRIWLEKSSLEDKQKVLNWLEKLGLKDDETSKLFG